MSKVIRVSDDIYAVAENIGAAEHRSVARQMELWAIIGKCALDNTELLIDFISAKESGKSLAELFEIMKKSVFQ